MIYNSLTINQCMAKKSVGTSKKSKSDSFQPKTRAMKSWKKKYLTGDQSENDSITTKTPEENNDASISAEAWKGFFHPLKGYFPLSIISYLNEMKNGYFCWGWVECAPPPAYYHLPRLSALFFIIFFLATATFPRGGSREKLGSHTKGVLWGILFGFLMFAFFSMAGWING